jgi:RNA polymerase sigma-70 factor, ECF subfamily
MDVKGAIDWGAIYEELYPGLVRYLHCKVWDADRATELAQETFVRALGARPENPRAWLFAVAANLARDESRLVVRRKKHLALLKTESAAMPQPVDPAIELETVRRSERVRRALASLSERDREVLLLRDAGLGYPEIAARTGLATGAVGTTLSRARRRLVDAHAALEEAHAARG